MSKPKFSVGQYVMFLKSMQMCKVVEIIPARRKKDAPDYIVQRLDSEKQLYASEGGLSYERKPIALRA
jgi:hypothetical protein